MLAAANLLILCSALLIRRHGTGVHLLPRQFLLGYHYDPNQSRAFSNLRLKTVPGNDLRIVTQSYVYSADACRVSAASVG